MSRLLSVFLFYEVNYANNRGKKSLSISVDNDVFDHILKITTKHKMSIASYVQLVLREAMYNRSLSQGISNILGLRNNQISNKYMRW